MKSKAWKQRERDVSEWSGGDGRTPLSGGNSKHTRADVLHSDIFIEVKLRKKHSAVTLWDKTYKLALKEGKLPLVALCEGNRPHFWAVIRSDHLLGLANMVQNARKHRD